MTFINKLLSYDKMMEWVNSPQAEGRINHEDNLTRLFQDILRDGQRDRRPGDDWTPSIFLNREDN